MDTSSKGLPLRRAPWSHRINHPQQGFTKTIANHPINHPIKHGLPSHDGPIMVIFYGLLLGIALAMG